MAVDVWVIEVGGGMNLTRAKLLGVMNSIERGEMATLVTAGLRRYEERLKAELGGGR